MKGLLLSLLTIFVFIGCGGKVKESPKYNYITAQKAAELIRGDTSKLVLVDIQEKDDFNEEHLKGAIATYAYPVKTEDERSRLRALLATIKADQTVIVICPRGGGGANRAYDFYLENGIKKDNLFTLKDGQYGWPRESIRDILISNEQ